MCTVSQQLSSILQFYLSKKNYRATYNIRYKTPTFTSLHALNVIIYNAIPGPVSFRDCSLTMSNKVILDPNENARTFN